MVTQHDSDALQAYLRAIAQLPRLTADESASSASRIQLDQMTRTRSAGWSKATSGSS